MKISEYLRFKNKFIKCPICGAATYAGKVTLTANIYCACGYSIDVDSIGRIINNNNIPQEVNVHNPAV